MGSIGTSRRSGRRGRERRWLIAAEKPREANEAYLALRVDDCAGPVSELRRIYEVAKVEVIPSVEALPPREEPEEIRGTLIPES